MNQNKKKIWLGRIIALILVMMLVLPCTTYAATNKSGTEEETTTEGNWLSDLKDGVSDIVSDIGTGVKNAASSAKNDIVSWCENLDLTKFQDGWTTATKTIGDKISVVADSDFVKSVQNDIDDLSNALQDAYGDAKNVTERVKAATKKWTGDIYEGAKTALEKANVISQYHTEPTAKAQTQAEKIIEEYVAYCEKTKTPKTFEQYCANYALDEAADWDLLESIYSESERIIPEDKLDEAMDFVNGRLSEEELSKDLQDIKDTLKIVKTTLQIGQGTKVREVSDEVLQAVGELVWSEKLEPDTLNLRIDSKLFSKKVVKQATGTGLSYAGIAVIMDEGPALLEILLDGFENDGIDVEALKEVGIEAAWSGGEGFTEGFISAFIYSACKTGKFGTKIKGLSPDTLSPIVGTITVLLIDSIINGYKLSNGELTQDEFGDVMAEDIIVLSGELAGGLLLQCLFPALPFAYEIGSFAGGMLASEGYKLGKEVVLEIQDAGGFEAYVVKNKASAVQLGKETISKMKLKEKLTDLKNMAITTTSDGYIKIKTLAAIGG